MTEARDRSNAATPHVGRIVAAGTLMGLAIVAVGTPSWVVMIRLNMRHQPDLPWAALATGCLLTVMLVWLSGRGWPRRTSAFRRFHLRLWRPEPAAWSGDNRAAIVGLVAALVGLNVVWVLMGAAGATVDPRAFPPTTATRFSVLLMGPLVAGVVEEAAFRGYMQSHLKRIGPTFAIVVTSVVFTLLHGSHGLAYLLSVAPGFFVASLVYGYLALKSGSILPGMALHFAGDLSYAYFVLLGGDPALLFVNRG